MNDNVEAVAVRAVAVSAKSKNGVELKPGHEVVLRFRVSEVKPRSNPKAKPLVRIESPELGPNKHRTGIWCDPDDLEVVEPA